MDGERDGKDQSEAQEVEVNLDLVNLSGNPRGPVELHPDLQDESYSEDEGIYIIGFSWIPVPNPPRVVVVLESACTHDHRVVLPLERAQRLAEALNQAVEELT